MSYNELIEEPVMDSDSDDYEQEITYENVKQGGESNTNNGAIQQ